MAVIIGKAGRRISRETALAHVAGYACYNDGSIRDWQHLTNSRPARISSAPAVRAVDGHDGRNPRHQQADHRDPPQRRRGAGSADLGPRVRRPALIAYCSTFTELVPGDVIVTGTTGGVGAYRTPPLWMKDGDVVEVEVSGIGVLRNPVKDEVAAAATRAA